MTDNTSETYICNIIVYRLFLCFFYFQVKRLYAMLLYRETGFSLQQHGGSLHFSTSKAKLVGPSLRLDTYS